MKNIFISSLLLVAITCCDYDSKENEELVDDFTIEMWKTLDPSIFESTILENYQLPLDHVEALQKLGLSGSTVQVIDKTNTETDRSHLEYLIDNDIEIITDDLLSMVESINSVENEYGRISQFRTTNLVNPTEILVVGRLERGLSSRTQQALRDAVDNYNNLGLSVSFRLVFLNLGSASSLKIFNLSGLGKTYKNRLIHVFRVGGSAGGKAGFPNNGKPYSSVVLYTGTESYSSDVIEHVFTHEIGHCIGMRHTDYFNRSMSCGQGLGSEGIGGIGAIHIPGTPQFEGNLMGADLSSIFNTCFDSNGTGEFTTFDIIALNAIY